MYTHTSKRKKVDMFFFATWGWPHDGRFARRQGSMFHGSSNCSDQCPAKSNFSDSDVRHKWIQVNLSETKQLDQKMKIKMMTMTNFYQKTFTTTRTFLWQGVFLTGNKSQSLSPRRPWSLRQMLRAYHPDPDVTVNRCWPQPETTHS